MRVLGKDGGDRLAEEEDLLVREDNAAAVAIVALVFGQVGGGDDGEDAGQGNF